MIAFNSERTDEDLFAQFQHCDCPTAFKELYSRYHWPLVTYLRRRQIISKDEEDIVQNVWTTLLTKPLIFKNDGGKFSGFIFAMVKYERKRLFRNATVRRERLKQVHEHAHCDFVSTYKGHGAIEDANTLNPQRARQLELLQKGLAQSPPQRVDLFLRYYAGNESQREVGVGEGLTKQQLQSKLVKQKRRLKQIIESDGAALNVWTAETIRLLGTAMDKDVAKMIGATPKAVMHKRVRLGIPAFSGNGAKRRWKPDEIAILGTDTDPVIGRRLNRNAMAVLHKRLEMGIPSFSSR